ncbi:ubiquitin-conjugating enzyme [Chloropicon primus]|uniref:E2 ubiquitin-conjugating enzyme n=1 Tax=Chloropicon primus TaxID=1764295 RepID=A0A5B8MG41_9CHLO|nr:ubiquitin-conjugating enzyme [Chloropicon primus]|mmetsp:Transcript_183/g.453  ORF Transcript_183/g.453 Transcript_183/m.453 type:complete len:155 (-) Transcript_183:96-560(-)|eukprot:QDZ19291.1 ubiquitin-conjugating enzyme [Chloropicon primus]
MTTRLFRELKEFQQRSNASEGIEMAPDESNIFHWSAVLKGPSETCYENGTFELDIRVPQDYPLVPPAVRFRTKIFHPNIHFKTGQVCLDILKTAWSPAWTLQSVCQAVLALLSAPEPSSPLNCDAGNLLRAGDVRGFNSLAKMYTIEFASSEKV